MLSVSGSVAVKLTSPTWSTLHHKFVTWSSRPARTFSSATNFKYENKTVCVSEWKTNKIRLKIEIRPFAIPFVMQAISLLRFEILPLFSCLSAIYANRYGIFELAGRKFVFDNQPLLYDKKTAGYLKFSMPHK